MTNRAKTGITHSSSRPGLRPLGQVHGDEDDHRRQEPLERGEHRRARQHHARERGVEDQPPAAGDRLDAWRIASVTKWKTNSDPIRCAKNSSPPLRRAQDVDEDEVHARQQQRVEDQPQLPEHRVEVLRPQIGARHLEQELAPPPQLAHVRAERRQTDAMRLVDVRDRRELVGPIAWFWRGRGSHGQKRLVARSAEADRRVSSATESSRAGGDARRTAGAGRRGSRAAPRGRGAGVRSTGRCAARSSSRTARRAAEAGGGGRATRGCARRSRPSSRAARSRSAGAGRRCRRRRRRDSRASITRHARSTPSWPQTERVRPAADALEQPPPDRHAPSQTAVTSLDRSGSPTRSRGTQSRGARAAVGGIDARLQQPEVRLGGRTAPGRARARRARRAARRRR